MYHALGTSSGKKNIRAVVVPLMSALHQSVNQLYNNLKMAKLVLFFTASSNDSSVFDGGIMIRIANSADSSMH